MPRSLLKTAPTGLLWLLALATLPGQAQVEEEEQHWYRVELLVFSHEDGTSGPEQWDPTPVLAYPDRARFLVEPERVAANIAAHRAVSEVDEFGRQILTLLPEPAEGLEAADATAPHPDSVASFPGFRFPGTPADPNSPPAPPLDPNTAADPNSPPEPPPDPNTPGETAPSLPTPFVALPADQREFRGKAAYMARTGFYHILFHQAWVQPVPGQDEALPLILDRSGDSGQWPLMQGSVKIFLARYLHLETNLWLNTPGDYLPGQWRMPPPPHGPPSLIIEEPPPPELVDAGLSLNPLVFPARGIAADDLPEAAGEPNGVIAAGEAAAVPDPNEAEPPVYPYRHAVLLQQRRRMRSNEVHYLDHPLFGAVVKLTPLSAEDLQVLAEEERAAESAPPPSGRPGDSPLPRYPG